MVAFVLIFFFLWEKCLLRIGYCKIGDHIVSWKISISLIMSSSKHMPTHKLNK